MDKGFYFKFYIHLIICSHFWFSILSWTWIIRHKIQFLLLNIKINDYHMWSIISQQGRWQNKIINYCISLMNQCNFFNGQWNEIISHIPDEISFINLMEESNSSSYVKKNHWNITTSINILNGLHNYTCIHTRLNRWEKIAVLKRSKMFIFLYSNLWHLDFFHC